MGDAAGAMRIWQLTDSEWQELATADYGDSVESLTFGPNNEFMMIGIEDSTNRTQSIHKLLVSQTAQVNEICRRLGERRFHPDECLRFLNQDQCPALCGKALSTQ
jgi:hypothetical protein